MVKEPKSEKEKTAGLFYWQLTDDVAINLLVPNPKHWVFGRKTEEYDLCAEYFGLGPFLLVCAMHPVKEADDIIKQGWSYLSNCMVYVSASRSGANVPQREKIEGIISILRRQYDPAVVGSFEAGEASDLADALQGYLNIPNGRKNAYVDKLTWLHEASIFVRRWQ